MVKKLGQRIYELRASRGWSQPDLATKLMELRGQKKAITPSIISRWESGEKTPSFENIIALSHLFDCSINYLRGASESTYDATVVERSPFDINQNLYRLNKYDLERMDRQPIWIESQSHIFPSQWVLYNSVTSKFVGLEQSFSVDDSDVHYFSLPLPNAVAISYFNNKPLTYEEFMDSNEFWLEIKSVSSELRNIYNGWWRHNEQHTAIINNTGYVLPYTGFNKSYLVYSTPFQNFTI